jgi:hypothetical protein
MNQRDETIDAPVPGTSGELVVLIDASHARLDAILSALPDEQLARPYPGGGWPALGHLTHLAAWERMIVAHVTDGTDHDVARMTPQDYERATLDDLNARIYDLHKDEPVAQVRAEYAAAHHALRACVERLTPEALARPYWPDDGRTVASKIAGDTYLHYDEHRVWILEIVDAAASGGGGLS